MPNGLMHPGFLLDSVCPGFFRIGFFTTCYLISTASCPVAGAESRRVFVVVYKKSVQSEQSAISAIYFLHKKRRTIIARLLITSFSETRLVTWAELIWV